MTKVASSPVAPSTCDVGSWRPTVAHVRAVVVAIVLAGVALVAGRPDLLVLAAPFASVAVWSTVTKPRRPPIVTDRIGNPTVREGDATTWRAVVGEVDPASVDLVTATVPPTPWIDRRPGYGADTTSVRGSVPTQVSIALRPTRWGRRVVDPIQLTAVSHWAAFVCSMTSQTRTIQTLPVPAAFDSNAPMRPDRGLVGLHRSARAGEGSEFAGIRAFAVGDRIRRINWARSLRSDGIVVNSTWSDQDTHIAFVIDAAEDYGVSGGIDGTASSLDIAVRAAGAIAEHVVARGDRVSLRAFGATGRHAVPAATGAAHLRRLLDGLTRIRTGGAASGSHRGLDPRLLGTGGAEFTVLLSPLIARGALDRAVALGRRGGSVVVIDTLPERIAADNDDPYAALAWRIRLLERRREIRRVQQVGIPVVRWHGPGSLDQFLRDAARRAAAPRLRVR